MRRVRDLCPVVPVGIRNVSEEEAEFVKQEKIRVFYARDIVGKSGWEHQVLDLLTPNVFAGGAVVSTTTSSLQRGRRAKDRGLRWGHSALWVRCAACPML